MPLEIKREDCSRLMWSLDSPNLMHRSGSNLGPGSGCEKQVQLVITSYKLQNILQGDESSCVTFG
jgi:hypothetical protein